MPRLVVLGTGTGVGKTFVTAALIRALRDHGRDAIGLKPIESGLPPTAASSPPVGSDAHTLERASSLPPPRPHPLHALPDAISPHLAARRTNTEIQLESVAAWVDSNTLQYATATWSCIETAGGALSPLTPAATNAELAAALEPARLLLVAPDSLGVLHDLTATLAALRARTREPDYVVLTAARAADASTGTNADELRRLRIADPIAVLGPSDTTAIESLVAALLAS